MTTLITKAAFLVLMLASINSCGADSSSSTDGDCSYACLGAGNVLTPTNNKVTITFTEDAVGQKHVIVPFVLGSQEKINGAAEVETKKEFSLSLSKVATAATNESGSGQMGFVDPATPTQEVLDFERAHNLRTLWNRFRSSRGANQSAGFWSSAREMDMRDSRITKAGDQRNLLARGEIGIEQTFRDHARKASHQDLFAPNRLSATNSAATGCPEEIFVIEADGFEDPVDNNLITFYPEGTFCLAVIKEEKLASETDVKVILKNITETLQEYQFIYPKLATATATDYSWKPLIVVLPFDDAEVWPQAAAYKLQGAFVSDVSEVMERPTLFIPSDFTKVGIEAEKAKESFHSAIVHELHHAVVNFFRVWVNGGVDETVSIDEGLAHYAEDLLGYGELNFPLFPYLFLSTFAVAPEPILFNPATAALSASGRGAAQTFWYYLVSSKGGVSFKDGTIDADVANSPGLSILRSFVEGTVSGTKGIGAAHGEAWTTVVGNFLGAVVIDGTDIDLSKTDFDVQDPVTGLVDTSGGKAKTFGMKYNSFRDLTDIKDELGFYPKVSANLAVSSGVKFYEPKPFIHEVDESSNTLEITFAEENENTGIVVVRVE